MTVKEMLAKMDSKEISEWQAYFAVNSEPSPQNQDVAVANMKAAFGKGRP